MAPQQTLNSNVLTPPSVWRWNGFFCEEAGPTMERDRILFEETKNSRGAASLRFYRWESPAYSYGRAIHIDPATKRGWLAQGFAMVQRPSGGGKVFHSTDLCFSLIWKKEDRQIPWKISDSYDKIHSWIEQTLLIFGIECQKQGRVELSGGEHWCFQKPVRADLLHRGKKIVGGAQWRDRNTALHQGSIQTDLPAAAVDDFKESFETFFGVRFYTQRHKLLRILGSRAWVKRKER